MQKIFITSVGTNIGKTLFTSALSRKLKNMGEVVVPLKPLISGFEHGDENNDVACFCEAIDLEYNSENIDQISLYKLGAALSPDQAANLEGVEINFDAVVDFCNRFDFPSSSDSEEPDTVIIEGVGGLYVPIDNENTIMDLIKSTRPDVNILVTGSYLGSLSHTISAIKNFESESLSLDLLVVMENLSEDDELYISAEQNISSLKNFFTGNILEIKHKEGSFSSIIDQISEEI